MQVCDREAKKLQFEALRKQLGNFSTEGHFLSEIKIPSFDKSAEYLVRGAINEFSGSLASGSLLLDALLQQINTTSLFFALVDSTDSFDPTQWEESLLFQILWIRCHTSKEVISAVDILLRDGNLPLIILDLQTSNFSISPRIWQRFSRILATSQTTLLVLSVTPVAAGVQLRFQDESQWTFKALQEPRNRLISSLHFSIHRKGRKKLSSLG